jgi:hypothetical protein
MSTFRFVSWLSESDLRARPLAGHGDLRVHDRMPIYCHVKDGRVLVHCQGSPVNDEAVEKLSETGNTAYVRNNGKRVLAVRVASGKLYAVV